MDSYEVLGPLGKGSFGTVSKVLRKSDHKVLVWKEIYPELERNQEFVIQNIKEEELKFTKTLERGLKEFEKIEAGNKIVSGIDAFNLFQTFGFPIEMTKELAVEEGLTVDEVDFNKELEKHQDLSRTASAGMFKGGLADQSVETTRLHTAAHLMLAGLRKVLGDHVTQKGSNITAERLRYDFVQNDKMTPEQIKEVEGFVNMAIDRKLAVSVREMEIDKAKEIGAMGVFESKYGELVKVYGIGEGNDRVSLEICGGPHVGNTSELGHFRIQKEESSSAGVRRIKAILE